jgi:hypothetical protein
VMSDVGREIERRGITCTMLTMLFQNTTAESMQLSLQAQFVYTIVACLP